MSHRRLRRFTLRLAFGAALGCGVSLPPAVADESPAFALGADVQQAALGPYLQILEDPEGTLEIADVLDPTRAEKFLRIQEDEPGFGFTDSVFWIKLTVHNPSAEPVDQVLDQLGHGAPVRVATADRGRTRDRCVMTIRPRRRCRTGRLVRGVRRRCPR